MAKNKFEGGLKSSGDPRIIERGTPEYFARRIEEHVKYFQPASWCEQIRVVMMPPYFSTEDWLAYKKGFDEGGLEEVMDSRPVSRGQGRWMIRAAIKDFFEKGKHNEK